MSIVSPNCLNPGERRNQYASKVECLCKIHDGSEHEIVNGYWLAKAVAADIDYKKIRSIWKRTPRKQRILQARMSNFSK